MHVRGPGTKGKVRPSWMEPYCVTASYTSSTLVAWEPQAYTTMNGSPGIRAAGCCPERCHPPPPSHCGRPVPFGLCLCRQSGPPSCVLTASQIACENFCQSHQDTVLPLLYTRLARFGAGDTPEIEAMLRVEQCSSGSHKESLPSPRRCGACSLFSLKSGLVCSVNKASELIGDLKELEGKGHALK